MHTRVDPTALRKRTAFSAVVVSEMEVLRNPTRDGQ
jgi:hypothetical protein